MPIAAAPSAVIGRGAQWFPPPFNLKLLQSRDSDVYLGSLSANALVTSSVFDSNFSYLPRVHGVFVVIPVIIFVFDKNIILLVTSTLFARSFWCIGC